MKTVIGFLLVIAGIWWACHEIDVTNHVGPTSISDPSITPQERDKIDHVTADELALYHRSTMEATWGHERAVSEAQQVALIKVQQDRMDRTPGFYILGSVILLVLFARPLLLIFALIINPLAAFLVLLTGGRGR